MINKNHYGKVGVLMGGTTAERLISLKSGSLVLEALRHQGVDAIGIDVGDDIITQLREQPIDRAFVALHGGIGEDGRLAAILEHMRVPFTGSGTVASALGMDKLRCKWLWQGKGLPTPPCIQLRGEQDFEQVESVLGFPVAIKPVMEGSSLGITKLTNKAGLPAAYDLACHYDSYVIAERWIEGEEYTVGIVGNQLLPSIKIATPRIFYDYEAKYIAPDTEFTCPSGLSAKKEQEIQQLALQAYEALGCEGWGRVDLMQDQEGCFWLLEVNTVPGMTDHSLVPMAAKVIGMDYGQLALAILNTSFKKQSHGLPTS